MYSGETRVERGTLLVTGSTSAASAVTVTNATLGGTGAINGPVTIGTGGELIVGNEPRQVATLSTGSLSFLPGSTLQLEIDGTSAVRDVIAVIGTITIARGTQENPTRLLISGMNGFTQTFGESFSLLTNDSTDAVSGNFRRVLITDDDGNPIKSGVNYRAGDGNDIHFETRFDFADAPTAEQSGFANSYPTTTGDDGARPPDNSGGRR